MSRTGLIIALVLAAALSALVYFLLKPPPVPPPSGPLLGTLDIGRVRSVEITWSNGRHATLSPGGPGEAYWLLEWGTPSGESLSWPAASTRVRAALRLLSALHPSPEAGPGPVADPVTLIVLTPDSGQPVRLRMSESPLGGRTPVGAEGAPGIALGEEGLAQVFANDLSAWREPAAFPIDLAETSRLELAAGGSGLALSRVGKNWGIVRPTAIAGDEPIIFATIKAIGSVACLRFTEDADPRAAASGFDAPAARVVAEIDRRVPRGEQVVRTTIFQELLVGGPADVAGQTLLCRLSAWSIEVETGAKTQLWGPVGGVINREALSAVSMDPSNYVSRVATRVPAPDVAKIGVGPPTPDSGAAQTESLSFVRAPDGWNTDKGTPATPEARGAVEGLIKLASLDRAQSVGLTAPEALEQGCSITLHASDGSPLDRLELGLVAAPNGQPVVCIRSGAAYRLYTSKNALAVVAWFSDQLARK